MQARDNGVVERPAATAARPARCVLGIQRRLIEVLEPILAEIQPALGRPSRCCVPRPCSISARSIGRTYGSIRKGPPNRWRSHNWRRSPLLTAFNTFAGNERAVARRILHPATPSIPFTRAFYPALAVCIIFPRRVQFEYRTSSITGRAVTKSSSEREEFKAVSNASAASLQ